MLDPKLLDPKLFAAVFAAVFVAELGDKTQLATMLFASRSDHSKWMVFLAASGALVLSSALGVLAGAWLSEHVSEQALRWVAGIGFVAIGAWILLRG